MRSTVAGSFVRFSFLGVVLLLPNVATAADALVLSEIRLVGTDQLSPEDVARGLDLKIGGQTSRNELIRACDQFRQLKLFGSSRCTYANHGNRISLTIYVEPTGMPIVFDNFVWTTRPELITRLKHGIPLFMPQFPWSSGITNDIIRVLQEVVNERGIKATVRYDDRFWTERGMNVFYVEGISTPVTSLQIEGENAPSPEAVLAFSNFYTKENFSAARLTWVTRWVIRDLYKPRGYLRAVAGEPVIQCLGEKDEAFPVRVILPIVSGDLYTFDSLNFEGLAKAHAASLLSNWKLKRGEPYNESYVNDFVSKEILDAPWAVHSRTSTDVARPCARLDGTTKKVSLTIRVEVPKKTYTYTGPIDDECSGVMEKLVFTPAQ
jgi:outer membrane protein assembly factor BamA